jgi:hypothetical protein
LARHDAEHGRSEHRSRCLLSNQIFTAASLRSHARIAGFKIAKFHSTKQLGILRRNRMVIVLFFDPPLHVPVASTDQAVASTGPPIQVSGTWIGLPIQVPETWIGLLLPRRSTCLTSDRSSLEKEEGSSTRNHL